MLYRSLMICGLAATSAFMAPAMQSKVQMSKISMGGKGFGGGEATRDPEPTNIDPNDPKAKQGAIHKAESFSDYLARRGGASTSISAPAPAPPAAAGPPRVRTGSSCRVAAAACRRLDACPSRPRPCRRC